jgi:hypothetical protein
MLLMHYKANFTLDVSTTSTVAIYRKNRLANRRVFFPCKGSQPSRSLAVRLMNFLNPPYKNIHITQDYIPLTGFMDPKASYGF